MPQCFEEHDTDGRGQIQAPHAWIRHRDFETVAPVCTQEIFRKSSSLAAKHETVFLVKLPIGVEAVGLGGEINEAGLRQMIVKRLDIFVTRELHFRPLVETRTSHGAIIHAEAGDTNDVKRSVGGSAEASDVAGVGRNLRLYKRDGYHWHSLSSTDYTDSLLINLCSLWIKQKETTSFA